MTTSDRTTMRVGEPMPAEPPSGGPGGTGSPTGGPALGVSSVAAPQRPLTWSERLALRNWNLPFKLAAVLLVPTVFVVSLGVLRIVEQTEKASSYDGVEQAVSLEAKTSALLADLAAERTAAGVYVASNRAGGPQALQPDIDASKAAAGQLRQAALSSGSLDDQTQSAYRQAATELGQLDRLRSDVLAGRLDPSGVVARYTEATSGLLAFDQSLSREAADPSVAGLSTGLYSLSLVREQDAFVEAVVASGLAAGRIDAPSIDQARNATLRRTIAVDDFRTAVGTDNAALAASVVGPDVNNRDLLAQVVLGRGSAGLPLQVSPQDWSRASQAVENQVTAASQQVRSQLQDNAAALQNAARNSAGVASVVLLLALLAGAAVVYFVTRSLLRPLRLLRRSALDVAERRLPGAVRSLREGEAPDTTIEPTPITTREEIGEVARAFDQVHEQAVRLAAEQAGLRAAFNAIFINLSRRSQALVERQLRLIEQLESNEEDPEALSNLFQLDHLATRMRRNSENLLVLSGTDLSRRGTRPVPLVDVLRAGVSEVEQYQRVDLAPPPGVLLLGGTASDVVHLVAELLENATTFSAPDTRVEVRATQGADGGVLVEIRDEGVGMSEQDLRDANTRLHSPPTVDVSASRRMGLFVVGRLATRHGIAVSLRARHDQAGIVASAVVPPSSVLASAAAQGQRGARQQGGPAAGGPTINGAAPFAPSIPAQEGSRSGDGEALPRRGASPRSTPASFFSPAVEPETGAEQPPAAEGTPTTNGAHGPGVAGLLPRRPSRGGTPTGADPGGPGDPRRPVDRPGAPGPDDADDDADDDARTAGAAGDDPDGVTVWRRSDDAAPDTTAAPENGGRPAGPPEPPPVDPGPGSGPQRAPYPRSPQGPPTGPRGPWGPPGPQQGPAPRPGPRPVHGQQPGPVQPPAQEPGEGQGPGQGRPMPQRRPQGQPGGAPAPSLSGEQPAPSAPPMWNGAPVVPPPGAGGSGTPDTADATPAAEAPADPSAPDDAAARSGIEPGAAPDAPQPRRTTPLRRRMPRPSPGSVRPDRAVGPPVGAEPDGVAGPEPDRGPAGTGTGERFPGAAAGLGAAGLGAAGLGAAGLAGGAWAASRSGADQGPADQSPAQQYPADQSSSDQSSSDQGSGGRPSPGRPPADQRPADPLLRRRGADDVPPEAGPDAGAPAEPLGSDGDEAGPRQLGRRRRPQGPGPVAMPGTAPRMRPRRPVGGPDDPGTPADEVPAGEGLFAPMLDAESAPPLPRTPVNGNGSNGNGTAGNGHHGTGSNGHGRPSAPSAPPGPGGPPRAVPDRVPMRAATPTREKTPIFDEVASVWFREAPPSAPAADDAEWATTGDAGWRAAAASTADVDEGTTEAGLPRRRPRARLVPGAVSAEPAERTARSAPTGAAGTAGALGTPRDAEAIRGRLASYQQGVSDGRTSRRAHRPDSGGDDVNGRPGEQEEQ